MDMLPIVCGAIQGGVVGYLSSYLCDGQFGKTLAVFAAIQIPTYVWAAALVFR